MKRINTILGNVGVVLSLQPTDIDPQLLKKNYPTYGMKRINTILGNVGVVLSLQPTDIDPQLLKNNYSDKRKSVFTA